MNLVLKLSLPSATISFEFIKFIAFFELNSSFNDISLIFGFKFIADLQAFFALDNPMLGVECIICLCKFESSTSSLSITVICPTPAAAKYNISGDPNPPAPIIRTLELIIFFALLLQFQAKLYYGNND